MSVQGKLRWDGAVFEFKSIHLFHELQIFILRPMYSVHAERHVERTVPVILCVTEQNHSNEDQRACIDDANRWQK